MKFLIDNWLLVLLVITSGTMLLMPLLKGDVGFGGIPTAEAVRLINREKGVLIDVGEPAEFSAGHASGARNIPLASLAGAKGLPTNKTLPLVVLCPSGTRATRAVAQLRKAGYERAVAVRGGTNAWREASLPIDKGA